MSDRTGQQVGNYQLVKLLGKGGFAEVYLGEHIHLGTPAAIKLLTAKLSSEEENHFREEARTIAWLRHPNIVRVLEFGVQDSLPYLVMDYAPNGTLRQFFLKGWKYDPLTILPYVQQVAGALQFAHDRKLIHRDVKPENMLLGENREVLLSDFGIAVVAQSSRHQDMQEVVGTLAYMAPEQIQAHPRPASDQYSLGVVVYEWLTGTRPFSGSMSEILAKQISAPPPPIRDQIPNVSPELEQIVMTALAKDPRSRFASVRAFATAFEQAAMVKGATARAASEIPPANPPGVAPAHNVISGPSTPANSAPGSNWPSFYSPSGPASTPSSPPISSGSGPYGDVISAPNAVPSAAADASPDAAAAPAWSSAPSGPSKSSSPSANEESNILDAPTIMGSFLPSTPTPQAAQPVAQPTPGWQEAPQISSPQPGWQTPQPIPSVPPGWASAPPVFPVGPGNASPGGFSSEPGGRVAPAMVAPPPAPTAPSKARGISRRTVLIGGIAGLVVLGGGATLFVLSQQPGSSPSSQRTQTPIVPLTGAIFVYRGHSKTVYNLGWSPDGKRIASGGEDHTVQVWDATTGKHVLRYTGHSDIVRAVAWSPNQNQIASGALDKTVQVWNASNGAPGVTYKGHTKGILALAWSPENTQVVSGGADHTAQVWNASNASHVLTYKGHVSYVQALAWSPNGQRIASGSGDRTVQVWDAATGLQPVIYKGHTDLVNGVAWSPDGTRIASASTDHTVHVWEAATAKPLLIYTGHQSDVNAVAWSPDGKYVVSASSDHTAQVWNSTTGSLAFTFHGHTQPLTYGIGWASTGNLIASTSVDATVQVWRPALPT